MFHSKMSTACQRSPVAAVKPTHALPLVAESRKML